MQPEAAEASEQHAKGEFPQRMYERDMFQTPFSETSVQAAALAQNIECFVASKMTAFPSVTDTDVAMSFKAALRRSKQKLSSDSRLARSQHGLRQSFICEPCHILTVLKEAQDYMQGRNSEVEYLLAEECSAVDACMSVD